VRTDGAALAPPLTRPNFPRTGSYDAKEKAPAGFASSWGCAFVVLLYDSLEPLAQPERIRVLGFVLANPNS
jgi:hypothetical protein